MKHLTRNLIIILLSTGVSILLTASNGPINPSVNLKTTKSVIDNELLDLDLIEKYVVSQNLDFTQLKAVYPEKVNNSNLRSDAEEYNFFAGKSDVPLGIPGFLWGFCFGVIGMLVVYLVMDEGDDRKKQVKNALYGCIVGSLLGYLLYALLLATTVSADSIILPTFNIA